MKEKNAKTGVFRKILKMLTAFLMMVAMVVAFISGQHYRKTRTCTGIRTLVTGCSEAQFIRPEDIEGILTRNCGELRDRACRSIDLAQIETLLDSQDVIRNCEVFFTRDGMLNVALCEREPILRIQTSRGGFYVDREGVMFPLQRVHTVNVPIVDGKVPVGWKEFETKDCGSEYKRHWLQGTIDLALALKADPDWRSKFTQFHCTDKYGLVLIPKEGQERFVIGEPVEIGKKIRKMGKYYTHIRPKDSEKRYRKVDLRYDGQIICK